MLSLGKGEEETCVLKSPFRAPVAVPSAVLRIAINERAQTEFPLANADFDAMLFQFGRCYIPI